MSRTLSDEAYDSIKERLRYIGKGSHLSIRKVAEEMNMSYTPVREAFLRLHKEGFLELVPKIGFFAVSMGPDEIVQIYEARECIEMYVFRKVFNYVHEKHIALLKEYLEEQESHLKKGSIYDFVRTDQRFHEVFLDIFNNQYLSRMYRSIREQYLICSRNIADRHSTAAIDEHRRLIECIEKKEFDRAAEVLHSHLQNAKRRVTEGYRRVD